MSVMVT